MQCVFGRFFLESSEPSVVSEHTYFPFIVLHITFHVNPLSKRQLSCIFIRRKFPYRKFVNVNLREAQMREQRGWDEEHLRMIKFCTSHILCDESEFSSLIWNLEIYPKSLIMYATTKAKCIHDSRTQNTYQILWKYLFCENGYIVLTFVKHSKVFWYEFFQFSRRTKCKRRTRILHDYTDTHTHEYYSSWKYSRN